MRVEYPEQGLDIPVRLSLVLDYHAHVQDELAELSLVYDSIVVLVNLCEQLVEFLQEALVLLQLEVEDDLFEFLLV